MKEKEKEKENICPKCGYTLKFIGCTGVGWLACKDRRWICFKCDYFRNE